MTGATPYDGVALSFLSRNSVTYLFQILLPRADNSGKTFPKQDYDRVKESGRQPASAVVELSRAFATGG